MLPSPNQRQRLQILATACLLSVALPAAPAWAQKTKTKPAPVETTAPAPVTNVTVDIPTIDAVDSNVDEDTLRAIFSGGLIENAEALATLTATSITIPEILVEITTETGDDTRVVNVTLSDLALSDVTNGNAASIVLASTNVDDGAEGTGEFNAFSAANVDIGAVLGLYGLVDVEPSEELTTIYTDIEFAGGTFSDEDVTCTIGKMSAAEAKARPLNYTFPEILAIAEALENNDEPSPELIGDALHMYVDLFTAFESSPTTFEGFDCSGTDNGERVAIKAGTMSMGAMVPGTYPSVSLDGLEILVDGQGSMSLGNFTFKEMDISGPIALIQAAPSALDEAWFEENLRELLPAFAGFSFSDVAIDVPDPDDASKRIKASIGGFDLTLADYINGIPSRLLTKADNIVADLPTDSGDEQLQQLIDLGLTRIDIGFAVDLAWNEAEDTIAVNEISIAGADLASVVLAGTITNATEALFSADEDQSLAAAMALAISHLKLDISDSGLSDLVLKAVAADQGSDPATMRPIFAGLAEGTVIGVLAGAAEAQKVGGAINAFVSGKAKDLTIEMTAKNEPGLSLLDFIAAEDDPTSLIGKVTIDATAQ